MRAARQLGPAPAPVSFGAALRVWTRIGLLSFGGPAAQIAVMHRELVDQRRWIDEPRFLHALSFCMLLPGPEATQLATYIGWLLHRTAGAFAAGMLFIAPGILTMLVLAATYASVGNVPWIAALFFGLKAAVLAVVVDALLRVARRSLRGALPVAVALLAFAALFVFDLPFPLIVLAAGALGFLAGPPLPASHGDTPLGAAPMSGGTLRPALACLAGWLLPVGGLWLWLGPGNVFADMALFFSKAAMVTFGGAYAVLAYVAQQAVENYGWLDHAAMLDGLGLAETTPGPLIMVLQFVGFLAAYAHPGALPPLLAGVLGGLLVTWVTFAPCFLWIFAGAPYVERLRADRRLAGALAFITAAVVGVILNLTLWFAIRTLFHAQMTVGSMTLPVPASADPWALLLAAAAALLLFRFRAGLVPVLAFSSLGALALHLLGVLVPPAAAAEPAPLVLESKIPLGEVAGRIDHFAIDLARRRLFVAELGNDSVGVLDLAAGRLLRRLTGLKEPQGLGYDAGTDQLLVAGGGDGSVRFFAGADLAPAGRLALGDDADNVRIDAGRQRAVVGYGSGALALIDPTARAKTGEIRLAGHPESFQIAPDSSRMFVNVPDRGHIALVAPNGAVTAVAVAGRANFPMALDGPRLLSVFRHPARLALFATTDGTKLAEAPTCEDADDVFVDAKRRRAYVSCGEGMIEAFDIAGAEARSLGRAASARGARTSLFVPEHDRLYVAVRSAMGEPAAIWIYRPAD